MQLSEGTAQQLVDQLDRAQDAASEALILRQIKNNVAGHELRKAIYIRAGLIPILSDILSVRPSSPSDDTSFQTLQPQEESVWWHASSIIVVLANAGTSFTQALLDDNLLSLLVTRLRITDPAERVALNILECLNAITTNLPLEDARDWVADRSLSRIIYTSENAPCLYRLVSILPHTWPAQQRLRAVLSLICNTCHDEGQISLLTERGLLDLLCRHLAAHITLQKPENPGQTIHSQRQDHQRRSVLPLITETIALIVQNSPSRTLEFATHPALHEALLNVTASAEHQDESASGASVGNTPPLSLAPNPRTMRPEKKSTWPPLTDLPDESGYSTRSYDAQRPVTASNAAHGSWADIATGESSDSLIVLWLLQMTRLPDPPTRIMAAKLVVILKSHHMLRGRVLKSLSALLVPVLVELLDVSSDPVRVNTPYVEQVPAILALLVRDHEFLQQATVEAKAIPKLAAALRANFDNTSDTTHALWWPTKLQTRLNEGGRDRSLGPGGPSRRMRLQMQAREGLLKAFAALAPDSDAYRKDICDQGALNHIIMALEPFHTRTIADAHCDRVVVAGNSSDALIAACGAVRALTRSPSSLRTKIVDADVAKHIVKLLYTPEPAVRVAATMVVANLSHGFSPMKSSIAESSVIKKLCEQAHSANAQLRRETLFALKAFINLSASSTKRMVVEELGVNWIRHLIATDPHDVPAGEVIGLVEKDYQKGSRIRVRDAEMQDIRRIDSSPGPEDYNHHTLEQDLEIQAELLGFLRNLTTGDNPAEIIDYILEEIGHEEFLQIMVDRLNVSTTDSSPSAGKIIQNCIYVVAHLAVADARYRLPISHNLVLMKQINGLLAHTDPAIRRACCWLIIGVVYSTTESHHIAVSRAKDLQRLGIVANLRRMEKGDLDTDVKERASTACDIFGKLLDKS